MFLTALSQGWRDLPGVYTNPRSSKGLGGAGFFHDLRAGLPGEFVGRKGKLILYGPGINAGVSRLLVVHLTNCGRKETEADRKDFVGL